MNGFIAIDRLYIWELVGPAEEPLDMVLILHDNEYPFWGLYPHWCWMHWHLHFDPIRAWTTWQGRN